MKCKRLVIPLAIIILCSCGLIELYENPIIESTHPTEKQNILHHERSVEVVFSGPVDPYQAESLFIVARNGLQVPGVISWTEEGSKPTLRFNPAEPFIPGESYTLKMKGTLSDHKGRARTVHKEVRFFADRQGTDAPEVVLTMPQDGVLTDKEAPLVIHFSVPMEAQSVEESIFIDPQNALVKEWQGTQTLNIRPQNGWPRYVTNSIGIGPEAASAEGSPIARPFVTGIVYQPPLERPEITNILVRENDPGNAYPPLAADPEALDPHACFKIVFSKPMNKNSVSAGIRTNPAIEKNFVWLDDFTVIVLPVTPFYTPSEHKLIVQSSVICSAGLSVKEGGEFTFIPKIEYQTIDFIAGRPDDGFPVFPPFINTVPITPIGPAAEYTFTIRFTAPLTDEQQRLQAQESISLYRVFPPDIPTPGKVASNWLDQHTLMVTYSGFGDRAYERSATYSLFFPAGSHGVTGDSVFPLVEDVFLYLEVE